MDTNRLRRKQVDLAIKHSRLICSDSNIDQISSEPLETIVILCRVILYKGRFFIKTILNTERELLAYDFITIYVKRILCQKSKALS